MGIRGRLKRLEEENDLRRMTLVCPECGEEFVVSGDAPLEYLVYEWSKGMGRENHRTPEDMMVAFEHGHAPEALVEKRSGLPFLSKPVSGMNLGGAARGA